MTLQFETAARPETQSLRTFPWRAPMAGTRWLDGSILP